MAPDESDPNAPHEAAESFLARWSRRKQAAQDPPAAESAEPMADHEAAGDGDTDAAAATEAPEADEASVDAVGAAPAPEDLPPPESLPPDSDFTAYLSKRVSSEVRRAALRRMFSSPRFNVRDGLDDYDEDYTQFQSLGDTVTAHMRHHTDRLRQRAAGDEAEAADEPAHTGETAQPAASPEPSDEETERSRPGMGDDPAGANTEAGPSDDPEHDDTA